MAAVGLMAGLGVALARPEGRHDTVGGPPAGKGEQGGWGGAEAGGYGADASPVAQLVRLSAQLRTGTGGPRPRAGTEGRDRLLLSYESLSVYRRGGRAGWRGGGEAPPATGPSAAAAAERRRRYIVYPASGALPPASLCALMGPSGSGKTTLLNALAGARSAGLVVRGTVRLGEAEAGRLPRGTLGYAPQDDVLQSTFTPYEAVSFAAAAALPARASAAMQASLVQAAISAMGLHSVAFTRAIGARDGGGAGLSGGERKRVAVACVLATCPSAALLDEPTSGLDAHSAEALVRMLQAVAAAGTTILFSVHQPSSQVFLSLDHLTLLSHGERLFSGRVAAVAPHLASCGLPACPPDTSLADHLLYLTCTAHAALAPHACPPGGPSPTKAADPSAPLAPPPPGRRVGSSASLQLRLQAWRTAVHIARHPTLLRTQLGVSVGMGVLLGAAFFGVKEDAAGFQNKASAGGGGEGWPQRQGGKGGGVVY